MKHRLETLALLALFATGTWAGAAPAVTVYKSPTCGCCGKWVEHMRASGFTVLTRDLDDVTPQKRRLGVPLAMGSCHTAEVDGYLIEGHVPAADIRRMLAERPEAKGLVSPGMPRSAPGMDLPGNHPYEVFLVRQDGSTTSFAKH